MIYKLKIRIPATFIPNQYITPDYLIHYVFTGFNWRNFTILMEVYLSIFPAAFHKRDQVNLARWWAYNKYIFFFQINSYVDSYNWNVKIPLSDIIEIFCINDHNIICVSCNTKHWLFFINQYISYWGHVNLSTINFFKGIIIFLVNWNKALFISDNQKLRIVNINFFTTSYRGIMLDWKC